MPANAEHLWPISAVAASFARTRVPQLTRPRAHNLWILSALIVCLFFPEELSFYVGNARLTVARLILIVSAPFLLARFFQQSARGGQAVVGADIAVLLAALWMVVADAVTQGIAHALASTAIIAMEFSLPYVAARTLCKTAEDVVSCIRVMCGTVSAVALFAVLDPIFGSYIIHNSLGSLTGYVRLAQIDFRLGLLRASSTLEHPILLGTVCTLSILMSGVLSRTVCRITRVCCFIGLLLSWSSGPLIGLLIGIGCFAYDRVFRRYADRWLVFGSSVAVLIAAVFIFSNNPLARLFDTFAFDPESGYYRLLIWQYGSMNLSGSPIFGLGLDAPWVREDWMPGSVDTFWLWSAMAFGLPGCFLMAFVWISPLLASSPKASTDAKGAALCVSLNVVIGVVVFIGFTVHFWGATWMLISMLVGFRATLSVAAKGAAATSSCRRPGR